MAGHPLTKRSGEIIAADLRKRRWDYTPQRAHHNRNPPGNPNPLITVKTKASCAARNDTTGTMTKVLCDFYNTAVDGTETDAGFDEYVFNPGGNIDSGKWCKVQLNQAGQYEFVVVKCNP